MNTSILYNKIESSSNLVNEATRYESSNSFSWNTSSSLVTSSLLLGNE